MAMFIISERTHNIIQNVFTVVYFVIVALALIVADPLYVLEQLEHAGTSIVSGVAALAHFVGVYVCVVYIVTFTLLLVLHFIPYRMTARCANAGFRKARSWVVVKYSCRRRCRHHHLR